MGIFFTQAAYGSLTLVYDDIEGSSGTIYQDASGFIETTDAVNVGDRASWVQNGSESGTRVKSTWFYGVGANSIYSDGNTKDKNLGVATLVDLSGVANGYSQLDLSFGYYGSTSAVMAVHLWVIKSNTPTDTKVAALWNEGWLTDYTGTNYAAYYLGSPEDGGVGTGHKTNAAVNNLVGDGSGSFVDQSYSFDLSVFDNGLDELSDYDYVMMAFHATPGAADTQTRFNDIVLSASVPEPSSLALLGAAGMVCILRRNRL